MKPSGIVSVLMILVVVVGIAVALSLGGRARSLLLTVMTVGELVFITLAVPRMDRGSGTGRRSVWGLPSATVLLAVLVVVTVLSWFVYAWEHFTF
jgi:hypothetical protein